MLYRRLRYRLMLEEAGKLRQTPMTPTHRPLSDSDFRSLFEAASGLYLILWPDFTIAEASDAYLRATMTDRAEILGRLVFDVFPDNPEDPEAAGVKNLLASLERVKTALVVDSMPVQKYDIRRSDADGGFEERFWSPINSPVLDGVGRLTFIVHRVEDVTEFVQLRRAGLARDELTDDLRRRAEWMEAEIGQRSEEAASASRRLKEANAELGRLYRRTQDLDRMKSQFFANVSHELRTPLALILGPVEQMLAHDRIDQADRWRLQIVQRNAHILLKHVEDLLEAARLEDKPTGPDYAEVDLAGLSGGTARLFESAAIDGGISFAVVGDSTVTAEVDSGRISRVLVNLLSNAFKFTPCGGRVRMETRVDPATDTVVIEVADSGPGIDPADREEIFERFSRVENPDRPRVAGTGLGLAIARELITLHGGKISVGEAPEGGALFVIDLPRWAPAGARFDPEGGAASTAIATETPIDPAATAEPGPAGPRPGSTHPEDAARVLVIEDNTDLNGFLRATLQTEFEVLSATTGIRGLELAASGHPDLILCDMMLPDLSGEEVLTRVRANPDTTATPVIILTAKADDAVKVRSLRQGADDYIMKPFSVEELRARVAHAVNSYASRRALQQKATDLQLALDSRVIIEQAKGIIATERNISVGEAFDVMRRHARHKGAKLQVVADAVVNLGLRP